MYKLQYEAWGAWCTVRRYKTRRAAMVNLVKKKFAMPGTEWRVSTEPELSELLSVALAAEFKKRI